MPTKKLEFKVGLFVVAGIVVMAGSVYWLERLSLCNNTRTVQVIFDDAGMLKVGNIVTERASSSLADYLGRNEKKLDDTADNFLRASRELKNILVNNSARVDSSMRRMDRISVRLESFIDGLDTLSLAARDFADNLNNQDGTLQMLLQDGRLYNDLRRAADGIGDLVRDIKANQGKYINLKIELF